MQVAAALALHDPPGGVQDLVAQGLGLCFGQVAVQGEEPEPGQQVAGDGGGLAPGGVDLVVPGRQMAQAGALPQRILSSTLAWVRWRASRNWTWPPGVLVAVTWYRLPSCCSNRVSWAPGCGFSRRIRIRMSAGQLARRSPPALWRSSPVSSATCASGRAAPSASSAGVHAVSGRRGRTARIRSSKSKPTE